MEDPRGGAQGTGQGTHLDKSAAQWHDVGLGNEARKPAMTGLSYLLVGWALTMGVSGTLPSEDERQGMVCLDWWIELRRI